MRRSHTPSVTARTYVLLAILLVVASTASLVVRSSTVTNLHGSATASYSSPYVDCTCNGSFVPCGTPCTSLSSSSPSVGKDLFAGPKTEPGCTQWLAYAKLGPSMVFYKNDGSLAFLQSGSVLRQNISLQVPKGQYVKYLSYAGINDHALNVKLTNAQKQDQWFVFSKAKNGSPYRFDGTPNADTLTDTVYFKNGHVFSATNMFAVTYCPVPQKANLIVTRSISPVREHQLLGGTKSDDALRLTFSAENEDVDVYQIAISDSGSGTSPLTRSVEALGLFKPGDVNPFATATVAGCSSMHAPTNSMCAILSNKQLVIPRWNDVDVIVKPIMKTDEQGAMSNDSVQLALFGYSAVRGTVSVAARGVQTNTVLQQNTQTQPLTDGVIYVGTRQKTSRDADIVGPHHTVVLSKVSSITNASPDPNGSAIPVGVWPIGQFTFMASPNDNTKNGLNKPVLDKLVFDINATNVEMDPTAYYFYNKRAPSLKSRCSSVLDDTTPTKVRIACTGLTNTGGVMEIPSGGMATFVLEGLVVNPKIANTFSSLQISLKPSDGTAVRWFDTDAATSQLFKWFDYPESVVNSTSYNG